MGGGGVAACEPYGIQPNGNLGLGASLGLTEII